MSNVLKILIEQTREKADQLAQFMAKTQNKLAQSQNNFDMLKSYQDECKNNMHQKATGGITGLQLRNQTTFIDKIESALAQQTREIEFLNTTLNQQRIQWQKTLADQRKYEALIQREQLKQIKQELKRDQKMNDEFAARIYRVQITGEAT